MGIIVPVDIDRTVPYLDSDHYWAEKAKSFLGPYFEWNDVADILEISVATMEVWFKGETNPKTETIHGPVINEYIKTFEEWEPCEQWEISWFGFIHAYLLKEMGAVHASRTELDQITKLFDSLEKHHKIHCPLGTQQAWGKTQFQNLAKLQTEYQLPPRYCLVYPQNGILTLTTAAQEIYNRIEWEGGWARRIILQYPTLPKDAPIHLDPIKGRGRPTIRLIDVVSLHSHVDPETGERREQMIQDLAYDIFKGVNFTISDIRRAVAYANKYNIKLSGPDDYNPDVEPDNSGQELRFQDQQEKTSADQLPKVGALTKV